MNENKKGIVPTLAISCEDFEKITNRLEEKEKEIAELKAKLEMYENGVYFSSENDELQAIIDKAIEELDKYINSCEIEAEHTLNNEKCLISVNHSKKVKNILQGNKWNEVEIAYLDDKPIGSDKK